MAPRPGGRGPGTPPQWAPAPQGGSCQAKPQSWGESGPSSRLPPAGLLPTPHSDTRTSTMGGPHRPVGCARKPPILPAVPPAAPSSVCYVCPAPLSTSASSPLQTEHLLGRDQVSLISGQPVPMTGHQSLPPRRHRSKGRPQGTWTLAVRHPGLADSRASFLPRRASPALRAPVPKAWGAICCAHHLPSPCPCWVRAQGARPAPLLMSALDPRKRLC